MAVGKNEMVLELGKHFLIIDSNKSFFLEDNQGFRAYRPAGAWQIDCWKLLPEQWHKIYPVYTLKIEWENSEADKDYIPAINTTDLDLGDGITGVSGQPVNITTPVTVANLPNVVVGEQNTVPVHIETGLQPLEVVSHANNVVDGFVFFGFLSFFGGSDVDVYIPTKAQVVDSFINYFGLELKEFKHIFVKYFVLKNEKGTSDATFRDTVLSVRWWWSNDIENSTKVLDFSTPEDIQFPGKNEKNRSFAILAKEIN